MITINRLASQSSESIHYELWNRIRQIEIKIDLRQMRKCVQSTKQIQKWIIVYSYNRANSFVLLPLSDDQINLMKYWLMTMLGDAEHSKNSQPWTMKAWTYTSFYEIEIRWNYSFAWKWVEFLILILIFCLANTLSHLTFSCGAHTTMTATKKNEHLWRKWCERKETTKKRGTDAKEMNDDDDKWKHILFEFIFICIPNALGCNTSSNGWCQMNVGHASNII